MSNDLLDALIRDTLSMTTRCSAATREAIASSIQAAFTAGAESVKLSLGRPAMSEGVARQKLEDALERAGRERDTITLVSWGASATGKSLFFNADSGVTFERTFVSVLKAVSDGRASNLGCGTGNHGNKARVVRTERDMRRKENRSAGE